MSTANYAIPQHDVLIHVDINPLNLGRNVHAQVALCSDSRMFLDRLLYDGDAVRRAPCPPLWQRIAALAPGRSLRGRHGADHALRRSHVLPQPAAAALGPDELIFVDVTAATHWASETIEVPGPRRYFTPADNQSMGWAIPAAIGAQQVRPDRQVVCVTGDGCFLMSAIETSTAARACLPVKFFVLDDGAYHYMQMLQEPVYRRTTATELAQDRLRRVRPQHGPGVQSDRRQRRRLSRNRARPRHPRPRTHPRRRQLRRPRAPLAERPSLAICQKTPE